MNFITLQLCDKVTDFCSYIINPNTDSESCELYFKNLKNIFVKTVARIQFVSDESTQMHHVTTNSIMQTFDNFVNVLYNVCTTIL